MRRGQSEPGGALTAPVRRPVFLCGFMATGKTSVGRALAARLQRPFLDLDAAIEEQAGCTIAELFARGEAAFRTCERQVLREVAAAAAGPGAVVATGGGAVVDPESRQLLKQRGELVLLEAGVEELDARLEAEAGQGRGRPLWAGSDGGADVTARRERLARLLESRRAAYAAVAAAGLRVHGAGRPPAALAELIARWIERGAPAGAEEVTP